MWECELSSYRKTRNGIKYILISARIQSGPFLLDYNKSKIKKDEGCAKKKEFNQEKLPTI